jgi:micrococcal nuclease
VARSLLLVAVAALSFLGAGSGARARDAGSFRLTGTVVRVVDGDTLDVRLSGGRRERVRVIGIDAPETQPRECFSAQATSRARAFSQGRRVTLVGDGSQDTRDRYSRLLAYVDRAGGDLGERLLVGGFARVYVFDKPFRRLPRYRAAEASARAAHRGLWGTCRGSASPAARPTGRCAPSYPTVCISPPPPDRDCNDVSARNFRVRHDVRDPDPHHFDGDGNGIGCEAD